jgi:hypothetical protein
MDVSHQPVLFVRSPIPPVERPRSAFVRSPAPPVERPRSARATRRSRRDARRLGQLSLADHIAFWRAHRSGRQCYRAAFRSTWPVRVRISVVLALLLIGFALSAIL